LLGERPYQWEHAKNCQNADKNLFWFHDVFVSLIEFSKHVQNEISAKVMPKAQNLPRILRIERIGKIMIRQKRQIAPLDSWQKSRWRARCQKFAVH
jgi:hypothetical protein